MELQTEMSLAKFLTRYKFITGDFLTRLTHDDVKILFQNLKSVSLKELKDNPEFQNYPDFEKDTAFLYKNNIILVNDGKETLAYYIPEINDEYIDYIEPNVSKNPEKEYKSKAVYYDYISMSNYELKVLLNNKFKPYRNRMKAKHELKERGLILSKQFKDKKFNEKYNNKEDDYGKY